MHLLAFRENSRISENSLSSYWVSASQQYSAFHTLRRVPKSKRWWRRGKRRITQWIQWETAIREVFHFYSILSMKHSQIRMRERVNSPRSRSLLSFHSSDFERFSLEHLLHSEGTLVYSKQRSSREHSESLEWRSTRNDQSRRTWEESDREWMENWLRETSDSDKKARW